MNRQERAIETTAAENGNAAATRPITYHDASRDYRSMIDASERFDELTLRDLSAQAETALKARGQFDPDKHGPGGVQPLAAREHLELLAVAEVLARRYRHPVHLHRALTAGATWEEVAAAAGADAAGVRQAYREWADGQHRLWWDYEGKFGMNVAEHAAAIERAKEREAGG